MTSTWMPRPPADEPRVVVTVDEVGSITFQSLLRDRAVRRVRGDLAIRADATCTPSVRAAALLPLVPARCVVARQAALWVHTGAHEPARVAILVGPRGRRPDPHPGRVTHEAELDADDVVTFGAVRVTSIQRTGLDLARWFPTTLALDLLARLVDEGFDARAAVRRLDSLEGYPGTLRASTTLVRLAGRQTVQERITGGSAALAPVRR